MPSVPSHDPAWKPPVTLACGRCRRSPDQIGYGFFADEEHGENADHYVWFNEGTLDRDSGVFLCDQCYIVWGMPSSRAGWKATPEALAELLMLYPDAPDRKEP